MNFYSVSTGCCIAALAAASPVIAIAKAAPATATQVCLLGTAGGPGARTDRAGIATWWMRALALPASLPHWAFTKPKCRSYF